MNTKNEEKLQIKTLSAEYLASEQEKMENLIEEIKSKYGEDILDNLIDRAVKQRKNAYAPYSGYQVGASILTSNGSIYSGNNAETVSYSETTHAEENAINAAIMDGIVASKGRGFVTAVAVSHASDSAPCGRCRQKINEHRQDTTLVIMADEKGSIHYITSLDILLPYSFGPRDLVIE